MPKNIFRNFKILRGGEEKSEETFKRKGNECKEGLRIIMEMEFNNIQNLR